MEDKVATEVVDTGARVVVVVATVAADKAYTVWWTGRLWPIRRLRRRVLWVMTTARREADMVAALPVEDKDTAAVSAIQSSNHVLMFKKTEVGNRGIQPGSRESELRWPVLGDRLSGLLAVFQPPSFRFFYIFPPLHNLSINRRRSRCGHPLI